MALTRDTTQPIVPSALGMGGMVQSAHVMDFVCKASEVYRIGDIVVLASGLADAVDAAQADGAILGVALQAKTAGSSVSSNDVVKLACAFPGACFTGSMTAGAATDHTPSATAATEQAFCKSSVDTVLGTDSYTGYLLLDGTDVVGGQCQVFRFSKSQLRGQTFTLGSTLPLNPRVDFVFRCSYWQVIA
jgi:hypothetical protein